jgi:hypothetical protein
MKTTEPVIEAPPRNRYEIREELELLADVCEKRWLGSRNLIIAYEDCGALAVDLRKAAIAIYPMSAKEREETND